MLRGVPNQLMAICQRLSALRLFITALEQKQPMNNRSGLSSHMPFMGEWEI
jgi:hypothetical protein